MSGGGTALAPRDAPHGAGSLPAVGAHVVGVLDLDGTPRRRDPPEVRLQFPMRRRRRRGAAWRGGRRRRRWGGGEVLGAGGDMWSMEKLAKRVGALTLLGPWLKRGFAPKQNRLGIVLPVFSNSHNFFDFGFFDFITTIK